MSSCCQGGCQGDFKEDICDDLMDHHHGHHKHHNCFPDSFKRPLVFSSSIPRNGQTGVSPNIKAIKLFFTRDFNNDRNLMNVENDIELWQGMNRVPIRIRRATSKQDGQCVILVIPLKPLLGGVTYKVRIKSTFIRLQDHHHHHRDDDICVREDRVDDVFVREDRDDDNFTRDRDDDKCRCMDRDDDRCRRRHVHVNNDMFVRCRLIVFSTRCR